MSCDDRRKWDAKYARKPALLETRPPSELVRRFSTKAPGGQALDIACGSGRHALYLAQHGFNVDAVDIAEAAIRTLQKRTSDLPVRLFCEDAETFEPPTRYDLIVMCNYLDRAVIRRMRHALNDGGLFVVETYMHHPDNEKSGGDPSLLLQPKELPTLFDDMEILFYGEYENERFETYRMRKQGIVAQKK